MKTVPAENRKEKKGTSKSNSKKTRRKTVSKKRPASPEIVVWHSGMLRFSIMACPKSPEQDICYICGAETGDHMEHFCPYNYIYGRYFSDTCRGGGDCPRGQHAITSRDHRWFLRRFIRVNNLPPGFGEWDLKELFAPFGPLLMWDVPRFTNEACGCTTEIRMSFGVVVLRKRQDGERAIDELNGYETGGRKLRVDWVYPSCV